MWGLEEAAAALWSYCAVAQYKSNFAVLRYISKRGMIFCQDTSLQRRVFVIIRPDPDIPEPRFTGRIIGEPTETSKQPTRTDYQPIRDQHLLIQSVPDFLKPTETSKQPIRTGYLGRVTGYQPIRDQYFLIRSVPAAHHNQSRVSFIIGLAGECKEGCRYKPIRTLYLDHATGYQPIRDQYYLYYFYSFEQPIQEILETNSDWLFRSEPTESGNTARSDCLFTCFGRFLIITFKLQVTLYLLSIMLSFRSVLEQTSSRVLEQTCAAPSQSPMVSISIAADQSTLVKRRAGDRTARSENAALRTSLPKCIVISPAPDPQLVANAQFSPAGLPKCGDEDNDLLFHECPDQYKYARNRPTQVNESIRTRYLGHVTGYQPIRIQYNFLIRSVPNKTPCSQLPNLNSSSRFFKVNRLYNTHLIVLISLYGGAIPHLIIKSEQTVMHFQSIGLTQFSLLSLGARELWSEYWPDSFHTNFKIVVSFLEKRCLIPVRVTQNGGLAAFANFVCPFKQAPTSAHRNLHYVSNLPVGSIAFHPDVKM
eukprot:sb/3463732/